MWPISNHTLHSRAAKQLKAISKITFNNKQTDLSIVETKFGFSMQSLESNYHLFSSILKKFGFRKYSVPASRQTFSTTQLWNILDYHNIFKKTYRSQETFTKNKKINTHKKRIPPQWSTKPIYKSSPAFPYSQRPNLISQFHR